MEVQPNRYRDLWVKIAATILLIVITGLIINNLLSANEASVFETTVHKRSVKLPDGSEVTLNKNSKLTMKKDFGSKKRVVNFEGEAFFDVSPDTTKSFIILTPRTTLEVTGTSFNVRAYDSIPNVEVTVKTGRVSLYVPQLQTTLELAAGERGIFKKSERKLLKEKSTEASSQDN